MKHIIRFLVVMFALPLIILVVIVGSLGSGDASGVNTPYKNPQFIIYDDSNLDSRVPLLKYPTDSESVTSPFGWRYDPINFEWTFHEAIDLVCPLRASTYAAASGKVIGEGKDYYGANFLMIEHAPGIETHYWHHDTNNKKIGDKVSQGEVIALCGSTGWSTASHQHFRLVIDGKFTDAIPYLRYGKKQNESED